MRGIALALTMMGGVLCVACDRPIIMHARIDATYGSGSISLPASPVEIDQRLIDSGAVQKNEVRNGNFDRYQHIVITAPIRIVPAGLRDKREEQTNP